MELLPEWQWVTTVFGLFALVLAWCIASVTAHENAAPRWSIALAVAAVVVTALLIVFVVMVRPDVAIG